jgi:predicted Holliday junction resolvase-like endonuclease
MPLLDELRRQGGLRAKCPKCEKVFRLRDAGLFDVTRTLPSAASEWLKQMQNDLSERRKQLALNKRRASEGIRITAKAVNIGKTVEKIAPSLPGFPFVPGDCRSLLEPIDYVVFNGLANKGKVDALFFVDMKTGAARLSQSQQKIRALVEAGKVSLDLSGEEED